MDSVSCAASEKNKLNKQDWLFVMVLIISTTNNTGVRQWSILHKTLSKKGKETHNSLAQICGRKKPVCHKRYC